MKLGRARVLVVDDNENDAELTLSALRGCNVADHVDVLSDGN